MNNNESELIKMLTSDKFDPPYEALEIIQKQEKISDKVLQQILALENQLIIGEFIENFIFYTEAQLKIIEKYIYTHLQNKNPLFVSNLIECANINVLLNFYDTCLHLICSRRNDLIVLASLDYIFENMQFSKIDKVIKTFRRVINNKSYYQNCQTMAALYLFRLTHDREYFDFLRELILKLETQNSVVIKNVLNSMNYNQKKYFAYHDEFMSWVCQRKKLEQKNERKGAD